MTRLPAMPIADDQTVNHEFINALTSVKCLTELLVAYPALGSVDRNRLLNIMRQEAERMVRLSNDLTAPPVAVGSF